MKQAISILTANALSPSLLTANERLDEVAALLAVGVIRLKLHQSSHLSADQRESSLDLAADKSGDGSVDNSYGVQ